MKTVWIHGAFATEKSFNFLAMGKTEDVCFSYDCADNLVKEVSDMKEILAAEPSPVHIVGHSLGGILAFLLALEIPQKVASVTTISAPFGGITTNPILKYVFPRSVFKSVFHLQAKYPLHMAKGVDVPHLQIVTNRGNNPMFFGEDNDGVVSVASQTAVKSKQSTVYIPSNHYEVLMMENVRDTIEFFQSSVKKGQL